MGKNYRGGSGVDARFQAGVDWFTGLDPNDRDAVVTEFVSIGEPGDLEELVETLHGMQARVELCRVSGQLTERCRAMPEGERRQELLGCLDDLVAGDDVLALEFALRDWQRRF